MTQGRQAGMGAGKDVDLGAVEGIDDPWPVLRIVQRRRIETPTGEGVGVAVHDCNALAADREAGDHRQFGEGRKRFRQAAQPLP